MSEPKFSKGAWYCDKNDNWAIRGMDKVRTAPPERELSSCVVCTINSRLVGGVANVALIAAAPEMYKMLEELSQAMYELGSINPVCAVYSDKIDELLAKARGEI